MIKQNKLTEAVCEQTKMCLVNINILTRIKDNQLLELEIQHFDLLLNLLQSNINVNTYLESYHLLFLLEKGYIYLQNYTSQLIVLENERENIVNINENVFYFVKILEICKNNLKKHINCERYDRIKDEIYYNHNVPSLIISGNKDLIKYYLKIECVEFKNCCSKEMVQNYEDIWKLIKASLKKHRF